MALVREKADVVPTRRLRSLTIQAIEDGSAGGPGASRGYGDWVARLISSVSCGECAAVVHGSAYACVWRLWGAPVINRPTGDRAPRP